MTEIYVDTDQLKWQTKNLRVFLDSVRRTGRDIDAATRMAEGYEGQLRRQVMAIAGHDESLVRTLANELEEMIERLTQITGAFEAADTIRGSNPALGWEMMRLIDGGMLLSSFPWEYLQTSPQGGPWTYGTEGLDLLLAGTDNGHLQAFAWSALVPSVGSEADYWHAFLVFLYVNGAIQTQPPLETWRSAAGAAGVDLAAYVATALGLREENVDAWLRAAEIHETGTEAAIGEMVDMVQAGETIEERFGFSMEEDWSEGDQDDIVEAVLMVSHGMAAATAESDTAAGVFRRVFDGVEITLGTDGPPKTWYCTGHGSDVTCQPRAYDRISPQTIAHELGHTFNARVANHLGDGIRDLSITQEAKAPLLRRIQDIRPYGDLDNEEIVARIDGEVVHVAGSLPSGGYVRTDLGYASPETPWQQHSLRWGDGEGGNAPGEDFADMFLGWGFRGFVDDPAGLARYDWMEGHMAGWIDQASQPIDLAWFGDAAP